MEKIQNGKYASIAFDLYVSDEREGDQLIHKIEDDKPEPFIYGMTPIEPRALEKALYGLQSGEDFDVEINSEEGFGDYNPEFILHLDRSSFMRDGKFDDELVTRGATIPILTPQGHRLLGRVMDVTDEAVVMDFNHPLAGKSLHYIGRVVEVRDATEAELSLFNHHDDCDCGCGHHHHHDDCDCGCDHHHHHDDCDCGCDHHHHHDDCDCGCDHHHHHD